MAKITPKKSLKSLRVGLISTKRSKFTIYDLGDFWWKVVIPLKKSSHDNINIQTRGTLFQKQDLPTLISLFGFLKDSGNGYKNPRFI